jgi:uncharacterized membrane protein
MVKAYSSITKFTLLSALLFLIIFVIEHLNHRFWLNDFKVYYLASTAFREGGQVYGLPFGLSTGFYKYSPFTLLLFTPFTYLSYEWASSLHFILIAVSIILLIKTMLVFLKLQNLFKERKHTWLLFFSILLAGISHIVRELHLGNINAMLVFALSLSLKFIIEEKPKLAGVWLALAILCKPYFLILILPLLLFRKMVAILYTGIFIVSGLLIPALFIAFEKNYILHLAWIKAMMAHDTYLESSHTISSLLQYYLHTTLPSGFMYCLCAGLLFFYLAYFWKCWKNTTSEIQKNNQLVLHFFLIIAVIPNLIVTDTEHFLFSLPLIAFLIFYLQKSRSYYLMSILIFLFIFYGCNSTDFFGRKLSNLFEVWGLTGISNLFLIGISAVLFSPKAYTHNSLPS